IVRERDERLHVRILDLRQGVTRVHVRLSQLTADRHGRERAARVAITRRVHRVPYAPDGVEYLQRDRGQDVARVTEEQAALRTCRPGNGEYLAECVVRNRDCVGRRKCVLYLHELASEDVVLERRALERLE